MNWGVFLINPFLSLILSIRNFRAKKLKNFIWAFTAFFGATISIGVESTNSDIVRYMAEVPFIYERNLKMIDWYDYYIYTDEIDMIRSFLALLTAQFTNNGYFLLIIYGLIFGFFYSRNIWFILERLDGKLKLITILLLSCFMLVMPIWTLGGFRFNTATHVFIYGLLPYLYDRKKRNLIWSVSTPWLFHFAFLLPVIVLSLFILLELLFKNKLKVYFLFFITSLIIGEVNIKALNSNIEKYAPEKFAERSEGYRLEEKVEERRSEGIFGSGKNWYAVLYRKALHWSLSILLIVIFWIIERKQKENISILRVLAFVYLFYGVANILSSIPSGGRYLAPASIIALSALAIFVQNILNERILERFVKVTTPLLILFIIVSIREGFYFISITTILGNPLIGLYSIGENISLNDILKGNF